MLPPRYLLRQHEIFNILKKYPAGYFLEIGYGDGDFLINLSALDFKGHGYDFSETAYETTLKKLQTNNIRNIKLLTKFPQNNFYEYIFLFEAIGYIDNPILYFSKLSSHTKKSGKIIFSFTNNKHFSNAEILTGEMKCFSKNEMIEILNIAGLECELIYNYGYPLSNLIKPLTSIYYAFKKSNDRKKAIKISGSHSNNIILFLTSIFLNRYTISPFAWFQTLFRKTQLGTGYLVVARKSNGTNIKQG